MSSERTARWLALGAWLAGGVAWDFLKKDASPPADAPGSAVFAAAGSFRALLADWFWLETNLAWERRDAAETGRLLKLAIPADPASSYYWINGARMLAFDLPAWANEADPQAPAVVQRRRTEAAAEEALDLLRQGAKRHGSCAAFEIEMANVCLYALRDRQRASGHYSRAAALPEAPPYAARIAARLEEEMER